MRDHEYPPAPPEIRIVLISFPSCLDFLRGNSRSPAPPAVNNWAAAIYSHFFLFFLDFFGIFGAPGGF